jgi:hypothetical protein
MTASSCNHSARDERSRSQVRPRALSGASFSIRNHVLVRATRARLLQKVDRQDRRHAEQHPQPRRIGEDRYHHSPRRRETAAITRWHP